MDPLQQGGRWRLASALLTDSRLLSCLLSLVEALVEAAGMGNFATLPVVEQDLSSHMPANAGLTASPFGP